MQLIDMQLPRGLLNVTFAMFVVVDQLILIITSSPRIGVAFQVIFAVEHVVSKVLSSNLTPTTILGSGSKESTPHEFPRDIESGLLTLRAFGWTGQNLALGHKMLDASQKSSYLLYLIQRWLTFVLDMKFAILATTVPTLAVLQKANGGFTGIALT
jgi:ATP-binding cassette, subfamily C (CFTR/MRP), member 1